MRKFKRAIQKAAIAVAIGAASITSVVGIAIPSVHAEEEYPSLPSPLPETYLKDAALNSKNDIDTIRDAILRTMVELDNDLYVPNRYKEHGKVTVTVPSTAKSVESKEEAELGMRQDLVNIADAIAKSRSGEDVDIEVYAYGWTKVNENNGLVSRYIYSPDYTSSYSAYKRTTKFIFEGNKEHPEIEDIIEYTTWVGGANAYGYEVIDNELKPNTRSYSGDAILEFDEVEIPEVEGWKVKSAKNTEANDMVRESYEAEIIYVPEDEKEPVSFSDYNEALTAIKEYAKEKGVEPKIEDLGKKEIDDIEEVKKEEKRLIDIYEDIINNDKDPVIYTEELWYDQSQYVTRTVSFVDEDGNKLIEDSIEKVTTVMGGTTNSFTIDGKGGDGPIVRLPAMYVDTKIPEIEGYEVLSKENVESKSAEKDEIGKVVYKKTTKTNNETDTDSKEGKNNEVDDKNKDDNNNGSIDDNKIDENTDTNVNTENTNINENIDNNTISGYNTSDDAISNNYPSEETSMYNTIDETPYNDTNTYDSTSAPETGDPTNAGLLIAGAASGLTAVIATKKRRNKNEN